MSLAAPQVSQADDDDYWKNHWNWYNNNYSRYYNRRRGRHHAYRYPGRNFYPDYRSRGYQNPSGSPNPYGYVPYYNGYGDYYSPHALRGPHKQLQSRTTSHRLALRVERELCFRARKFAYSGTAILLTIMKKE